MSAFTRQFGVGKIHLKRFFVGKWQHFVGVFTGRRIKWVRMLPNSDFNLLHECMKYFFG